VMTVTSAIALRAQGWPRGRSLTSRPLALYYLLAGVLPFLARDMAAAHQWAQAVILLTGVFLPAAAACEIERLRICRFVVCLAAVLSVYAVVEMVLGLPNLWGGPSRLADGTIIPMPNEILLGSGLGRAEATLGHPLLLAFLLLVAVGLTLHGKVVPRGRWLIVLVLLCGLLATGSRSAAMVALLLLLFTSARRGWVGLVVGSVGLICILVVAVAAGLVHSAVVQNFLSDPSLSHRLAALEAAIDLADGQAWWRSMVGNGYWTTVRLFQEGRLQDNNLFAIDNQFVHTFAELGLVGVALLLWILGRALLRTDGLVLRAVAAAVVMFLSFDVLANPPSLGLLALLFGLTRERQPQPQFGTGPPRTQGEDAEEHRPVP
jgi:hypothetical protein